MFFFIISLLFMPVHVFFVLLTIKAAIRVIHFINNFSFTVFLPIIASHITFAVIKVIVVVAIINYY